MLIIKLTLSVAIVSGTSSPRTSFKKISLKDRSIMRESSIALATNCPMTRNNCPFPVQTIVKYKFSGI